MTVTGRLKSVATFAILADLAVLAGVGAVGMGTRSPG